MRRHVQYGSRDLPSRCGGSGTLYGHFVDYTRCFLYADINRPMSKRKARIPRRKAVFFFRSKLTLPEGEGPSSRSKLGRTVTAGLHASRDSLYRTARGQRQHRPRGGPRVGPWTCCRSYVRSAGTTRSSAMGGVPARPTTTGANASGVLAIRRCLLHGSTCSLCAIFSLILKAKWNERPQRDARQDASHDGRRRAPGSDPPARRLREQ
jgi:hypothetical protein